jgi:hypothetical protein
MGGSCAAGTDGTIEKNNKELQRTAKNCKSSVRSLAFQDGKTSRAILVEQNGKKQIEFRY